MKPNFWKFLFYARNHYLWLFIFLSLFFLRLPTLFYSDFYDSVLFQDITRVIEIGPRNLYELVLKAFLDNITILRLIAIVIVGLTSVFVFLLARKIYSSRVGFISSILYVFFISSFGSFLDFNKEIFLSLFFMIGFYSFYMIEFEDKKSYLIPLIFSVIVSMLISFKGTYFIFSLIFYILVARPFWAFRKNKSDVSKYFLFILIVTLMGIILILVDWHFSKVLMNDNFKLIIGKYYDNFIKNNLVLFIPNLLHKVIIIFLFNFVIWFFAIKFFINFFKDKVKRAKEFYIISIVIFLLFTVFISGLDIRLNSFIFSYPLISIMAGIQIFEKVRDQKLRKTIFFLLFIPVLFFFIWNTKDLFLYKYDKNFINTFNSIISQDYCKSNSYRELFVFIKSNPEVGIYPYSDSFVYFYKLYSLDPNFISINDINLKKKKFFINLGKTSSSEFLNAVSQFYVLDSKIGDFEVWKLKE